MTMPPDSVPALLKTRLFEICMLCAQPCRAMPPPPCELSETESPSMLDGLHWKLLGYGLGVFDLPPPQFADVRSDDPVGKSASAPVPNTFAAPAGMFTPFARTVIPAPS